MRPGTPGFNGARLREGREARGFSTTALADLLEVSKQAVSQYESNSQTPAPHVMRRISEALRLPYHFFLASASPEDDGAIFWRSMATATKSSRLRGERLYGWVRDIAHYLKGYLRFPAVNFPQFDASSDPVRIRDQEIEEIATDARRFWGLKDGPISNILWLIENNGAIISRFDLEADKLDACSHWSEADSTPYFIFGAGKESAARSRFDAAHELGHMLLHRTLRREAVANTKMFPWIESQANRFAGAFLLPSKSFADDVRSAPTLDLFRSLKPRWKVSIAFMIKRSRDLNIVSQEQERRLWINYSSRQWRRCEPLDDELPPEQPRLLKRSIELIVSRGIVAPSDISFRLMLPASDIERLSGLERGFLDSQPDPAALMDQGTLIEPSGEGTTARIIRFPGTG